MIDEEQPPATEHVLYMDGPEEGGPGVYYLVADTGEHLSSHYCSERAWAPWDLEGRRTASQAEWRERFGAYRVVWLGQDAMTREELERRNLEWARTAELILLDQPAPRETGE